MLSICNIYLKPGITIIWNRKKIEGGKASSLINQFKDKDLLLQRVLN